MRAIGKIGQIIFWIICILPILFLAILAFSETWRFPDILPKQISLKALNIIFSQSSPVHDALLLSFFIAGVVSILAVALAFIISKHIAYHAHRQLFIMLAYLPFVLSPVIYAASIYYFFVWMHINATVGGVILVQLFIVFPYNIILFMSHWNARMQSFEQQAETLGSNRRQTLFRVLIPLSKNILFA